MSTVSSFRKCLPRLVGLIVPIIRPTVAPAEAHLEEPRRLCALPAEVRCSDVLPVPGVSQTLDGIFNRVTSCIGRSEALGSVVVVSMAVEVQSGSAPMGMAPGGPSTDRKRRAG